MPNAIHGIPQSPMTGAGLAPVRITNGNIKRKGKQPAIKGI
jgi:hypothetical protein